MTRNESEILGGLNGVAIVLRARRDVEMAEVVQSAEAYIRNQSAEAASSERVAILREALADVLEDLKLAARANWPDPCILTDLRAMCERHGYGNVMSSASALWRDRLGDLKSGAFVAGPCLGTVQHHIAQIETALTRTATDAEGGA